MSRKLEAPVQWVRSVLLVGAIVGLTGSSGCWNCGPQKRKPAPAQPFNPNPTPGTTRTPASTTPYRNLPQSSTGQEPTGQTAPAPTDPTGKGTWGQPASGNTGAGSSAGAGLAPPSGNTVHYVPSPSPAAPPASD